MSFVPHLGSQKKDACHTINHLSPPLVATAHLAQPHLRAQQDHAKQRVQGSHNSGPSQSMQISWGLMDRGSTQESYVSNLEFSYIVLPHKMQCLSSKNARLS